MSYAANTTVSVEKSRAEIEATLARYGADSFAYATSPGIAIIGFQVTPPSGIRLSIRMTLPIPRKSEERFTHRTVYGRLTENSPEQTNKLWEQACRSSWRSLCLVIKAKLEACASGISTVEREFMADIMLPNGQTMGQQVEPQLRMLSEAGRVPQLMLT